jgi:hypothetical protein
LRRSRKGPRLNQLDRIGTYSFFWCSSKHPPKHPLGLDSHTLSLAMSTFVHTLYSPSELFLSGLVTELTLRICVSADGRDGGLVLEPEACEVEGVIVGGNGFRSLAFRTNVARSGEEAVPGDLNSDFRLGIAFAC